MTYTLNKETIGNIPEITNEGFPKIDLGKLTDNLILPENNKEIITSIKKPDLGEVIPAIPTLFTENNEIDYEFLENLLKEQSKAGIKEVLIAGTTGLSSLMNHKEQIEYIEKAVKIAKKYDLKVIAGTGSNNTAEANLLTEQAFEKGAVASLLLPPYYLKASNDNLLQHLIEGLNKGPGIIYSISGRTGIQIPIEVLKELSKHPNFIGVKECDGEQRIKELTKAGIKVWSGNDDEVLSNVHNGGAYGTITVAGNLAPEVVQELVINSNINSNMKKISDFINHLMFLPGQPNPKGAVNLFSMIKSEQQKDYIPGFRMPTGPFSIEQQKYVKEILDILGINSKSFGNNYKVFS